MARTRRLKREGSSLYHLMSRTNDKRFLFERGPVKTALVDSLRRAAEFSGIVLKAYAAMDNHFHVVVNVARPDVPVPAEELLRRVGVLKGVKAKECLAEHWKDLAAVGLDAELASEQDRLRSRMNDISEFIKTFKDLFGRAYRGICPHYGTLWAGRFKSTLIEDGEYLRRCMRYVYYNPVRAGIVNRAIDYRWSWCESIAESQVSVGPVPEVPGARCLKRVVQIGEGKVFGSFQFVTETAIALGDRFAARHVGVHPVEAGGYSTHGWKLAKTAA